VSYQVNEMIHVNEVIVAEDASGLQDVKVDPEEVDMPNPSTIQKQVDEDAYDLVEADNVVGELEDDFEFEFV